ncbi:MAG: hypothetical protein ACYS47_11885 [Planctomycetota bacterium]
MIIFLGRALLFPWWSYKYQAYPYETGEGYLDYAGDTPWTEPDSEYKVGREITGEIRAGYIVDSEVLQGYRFYGKLRLTCWITFDFDVTRFHEWVSPRDFDQLTFGKINVLFNVSSSPWHDLDFGFGVSYMEGIDLFGGPNAKATLDVFPVKPLGLHASWASSGFDGATLHEVEIGAGFFIQNWELRFGYRRLYVEGTEIGGPMVSVAVWF